MKSILSVVLVSAATLVNVAFAAPAAEGGICLAVCFPEPVCPEGLVVGGGPGCYTCCTKDEPNPEPAPSAA